MSCGGGHLPFIKDDFQGEIRFLELAANKMGNQKAGDKYLFEMEIQEPFYRICCALYWNAHH